MNGTSTLARIATSRERLISWFRGVSATTGTRLATWPTTQRKMSQFTFPSLKLGAGKIAPW